MADQPEALRWADFLDQMWAAEPAAELRRLHAVNQELLEALNKLVDHIDFIPTDPYYRNETKELMDAARAAIAKAEEQK